MRNLHDVEKETREKSETSHLDSKLPQSPATALAGLSERLFGIQPTPISPGNPFHEAARRNSEQAAKMERLEAELDAERQRRMVAEAMVVELEARQLLPPDIGSYTFHMDAWSEYGLDEPRK